MKEIRIFLHICFMTAFLNTGITQVNIAIQNTEIETGTSSVSIPIIIEEDQSLVSPQFTVFWDGDGLTFTSLTEVTPSGSGETGPLFGASPNLGDTLTYTWVASGGHAFSVGDTIVILNFDVTGNIGDYPINFYVDDHPVYPVPPEAGDPTFNLIPITSHNGVVTVVSNVAIGIISTDKFALYQNQPNPFQAITTIKFNLPEAMIATISVIDISGRIVYSISDYFIQEYNEVIIDRSELSATGLYYYKLETPVYTSIKKMTLIE